MYSIKVGRNISNKNEYLCLKDCLNLLTMLDISRKIFNKKFTIFERYIIEMFLVKRVIKQYGNSIRLS